MSSETAESPAVENTFEDEKQIFIGGQPVQLVEFRTRSVPRTVCFVILSILTIGIFTLVCTWFERLWLKMTTKLCSPQDAQKVAVVDEYGHSIISERIRFEQNGTVVNIFTFKRLRYAYNEDGTEFTSVQFTAERPFFYYESTLSKGIHISAIDKTRELNGLNSIEVPVTPIPRIVVEQAIHPFIVFQIFSIIVWSCYDYYTYASLVAAMTIFSVVMQTISTYQNMTNLHKMTQFRESVNVFRRSEEAPNGAWSIIDTTELVPGDVFEVTNDMVLSCDAVLLPGSQAIMNETMLTGESVPVVKTGIPHVHFPEGLKVNEDGTINEEDLASVHSSVSIHDILDMERDKTYILFSGTKVVRVRGTGAYDLHGALGIAVRTGFSTAKGQLVRSILYPKPTHFAFYTDSFKFIGVMAILALIGFIVNAVMQSMYGEEILYIFLKAGDLVTTVVPPTLPAVMAAGTSYALARLKKKNIFCIDSQRINVAGKIDVMCFDKTGTLTEEDLSVLGAMSTSAKRIPSAVRSKSNSPKPNTPVSGSEDVPQERGLTIPPTDEPPASGELAFTTLLTAPAELQTIPLMQLGMSCCHSVAAVGDQNVGDPLDVKMYEFTKWSMIEKGDSAEGAEAPDQLKQTVSDLKITSPLTNNYEALILSNTEYSATTEAADQKSTEMAEMPADRIALGILRRFDFSSHLQRMSVIVQRTEIIRAEDGASQNVRTLPELDVFVKGSPEIILSLCDPATVPADFESVLASFTHRGLRVIAFGHRTIRVTENETNAEGSLLTVTENMESINALTRGDVEQNLDFLGFFILENKLRPSSAPTLEILTNAGIRSLMITGDNVLTAINIARECDLIPAPPLYVPSSAEEQAERKARATGVAPASTNTPLDEYPVFVAKVGKHGNVYWECPDYPSWTLNTTTLEPVLASTAVERTESAAPPREATAGETQSVYSVSSVNTNGRAAGTTSPSPSLNSAATGAVSSSSAQLPNPANTPSVEVASYNHGNSVYSLTAYSKSLAPSDTSSIVSVHNLPVDGQTPAVYNPFAGWNGGPYGPLYWRGQKFPESFTSGPKDQPPPSCYFLAVTGAAFRKMYNEEQEKLKTLDKLRKAAKSGKDYAAAVAYHELDSELTNSTFRKVCFLAPVFARMSPDDKAHLVETLISLDHITGMCGDGANDCGALKAAHVGISLSEVEASIAAPFTSHYASIACVEQLILEGRGSLVSSFHVFKTTATFAMIQFASVAILIAFNSMLSDYQYLVIDILLTLPVLFTIGYLKPSPKLIPKQPIGALVSFPVISSMFFQIAVTFVIQILAIVAVKACEDFEPLDPYAEDADINIESFEATAVFLASVISYWTAGVIINMHDEYLERAWTNWLVVLAFLFVTFVSVFCFVTKWDWFIELMQLVRSDDFVFYRYCIIALVTSFIFLTILEYFVARPNLPKTLWRKLHPRSRYEPHMETIKATAESGNPEAPEETRQAKIEHKVYKKKYYALINEMQIYGQAVRA